MPSARKPTRSAPERMQSPLDLQERARVSLRLKNIINKSFTRAELLAGKLIVIV